jgi:hypothetical protein
MVLPQQERRVLQVERNDILSQMAFPILLVLLSPSVAGGEEEDGGALGEGGCGGEAPCELLPPHLHHRAPAKRWTRH